MCAIFQMSGADLGGGGASNNRINNICIRYYVANHRSCGTDLFLSGVAASLWKQRGRFKPLHLVLIKCT